MNRKLLTAALVAALSLVGCSSIGQMLNSPTGPNAPLKTVSASVAEDVAIFRGVVAGECQAITARVDGFVDLVGGVSEEQDDGYFRVGCLLPVMVKGDQRRIWCAGLHEPKCIAWGLRAWRTEVSFTGQYVDLDRRGVYKPNGKDQLKGTEI